MWAWRWIATIASQQRKQAGTNNTSRLANILAHLNISTVAHQISIFFFSMRLTAALSFGLTLLSSFAAAQTDKHIDIFAWPMSASKSQTLAKLTYNTEQATVLSYKAPALPAGEEIVRIGFHHPATGSWSGIATSAANFAEGKDKRIQLLLNEQGEVYHVGFKTSDWPTSSKGGSKKDEMSVEVVPMKPASTIHLNKPVVLDAEGKLAGQPEEKTFLQKYAQDLT
jgi:hypothetical protein